MKKSKSVEHTYPLIYNGHNLQDKEYIHVNDCNDIYELSPITADIFS